MLDAEAELLSAAGLSYSDYLYLLVKDRKRFLTSSPLGGIILPSIEFSVLINEVHDSLVADLFPPTSKRDLEIYVESMRAVKSLRSLVPAFTMPLNVDIKVGPAWGLKG
jgi:hypothetical protein